ncbi:hypothetical protein Z517_05311 [Fonsecaea pedrosoi CBS 271.37]|uniref:ubiquitinyl hydrolase 1 n=1 Tax=Fonsecaea pedrosoi CBS 271.37 TaxID=1442368 RepID=A0A0D2HCM6_9EURO|nr:uncharacterized protein Z517_05311 [Fonsecaea pedrosoi CBS 271.37]KIW82284.1 hypothetical protein Z517_05311 [Fonsecaea pedrosoi CBS 271.37]
MRAQSMDGSQSSPLWFMIHHMFLPPKLPSEDDSSPDHEKALLDTTIAALREFKDLAIEDSNGAVDSVIRMVTSLSAVLDSDGHVNEGKLSDALRDLPEKGGTLLLHIRAQNAGVMVGQVGRSIHVEVFELSPLNGPVITTKGRLQRAFPGSAVALTIDAFAQPSFQATVAHTLAKMSHQLVVDTKPKARKAGRMHDENRDTTHPKMVTELFMGFLGPVGTPMDVSRLSKNTREEVLWLDALLPWRRSPVWILLRVAMHMGFSRSASDGDLPAGYYKTFMSFLMAKVLELSLQSEMPCDLLYIMNAKLNRRLIKLHPSASRAGITVVESVMSRTAAYLCGRWKRAIRQASLRRDLSVLENLDFKQDVSAPLRGLAGFVNSLSEGAHRTATNPYRPTSMLVKYQADALPTIPSAFEEYTVYNLKAFEEWVASCLPQWLEHHRGDADTCGKLGALIVSYYRTASPLYTGNPESFSTLLLTIIELWIACDQSAVHLCKFLKDYDPGVPPEVAQGLLLPFKCQMQRLLRAEDYLKNRQRVAHHASPSIFRDYGQSDCFAVRYFNQSSEHQRLRDDIVLSATWTRDAKVQELNRKKEEYCSLMQRHDCSVCEYQEVVVDHYYDIRESRHSDHCVRCGYKSQADRLTIDIHEWPLPQKDLEAKSAVFELRVPPFFGQWRDTALFLHVQVFQVKSPSAIRPQANHPLESYSGLSSFFVPHSPERRLNLLSESKPHAVTHRRRKSINITTQSDVCLSNGLQYRYFDGATGTFIDSFETTDVVADLLTYSFPASSSPLRQFLFRPSTAPSGPSPNTVIASQSDCPAHMSLDEYKALCIIPLGYRIQWHNILLQLAVPSVDFGKDETSLVVLQSIYQAGPPQDGDVLRAGHEVLRDPNFATALLRGIEESLERVRENWESSQAVATFISVLVRLLSLTGTEDIKTRCRSYLRAVRTMTFGWVNLLIDKAYKATDDSHRAELLFHAAQIALVCTETFDVDERSLAGILSLPEDGSVFLQCCMLIRNSASAISGATDPLTPILYQRWRSLCYRSYTVLAAQILGAQSRCLDEAIGQTWVSYKAGDGWRPVSDTFDHWLFNTLSSQGGERPVVVHYNLLTGEFLVDGLPLARLPSEFMELPVYRTLFGQSDLEVMPSTLPGMQFSVKHDHAGYAVHLDIRPTLDALHPNRKDLRVRAVKDGRTYDLVPSWILQGEFPVHFTADFVHWYDTQDDYVECRPVGDPWNSSPDNWRLIRDPGQDRWHMVKGGLSLISLSSQTSKVIGGILSRLETPEHVHIVRQCSLSTLEIELPRLSLAFSLESGTSLLESKQFRGLAVDTDQSLETLVGLQSKLILKNMVTGRRLLVVPTGHLSCQRAGDHVRIIIHHEAAAKAHAYPVDDQLGRLLDNGTLQSKLWLCYLHALTSFCLVDPLIKRTGTEQALFILSSAAVRSFDRLHRENIDVLRRIALLTPGRSYYPAHERVMQIVKWTPELSFLAQHGGLYKGVQRIFDQAERTKVFYPGSYVEPPALDHVQPDLLDRDRIRSSTFDVSGFGAEDHTVTCDSIYSARDRGQNSSQGSNAFLMSTFAFQARSTVHYRFSTGWSTRVWHFLSQAEPILGLDYPLPSELRYDAGWLQDWAKVVAKHWCTLHQLLSSAEPRFDRFRLMIWLSTLVFAKNCDIEIIQSLGAFFVLSRMTQLSPPAATSFRLSEGSRLLNKKLRSALRPALRPFSECPESCIARGPNESKRALKQRQESQFQSNQDRSLNRLMRALEIQWPVDRPVWQNDAEVRTYMNMNKVKQIAQPLFSTWYDNYQLQEYLSQVEDVLQDVSVTPVDIHRPSLASPAMTLVKGRTFISIDDIFTAPPPSMHSWKYPVLPKNLLSLVNVGEAQPRLPSLLDDLQSLACSSSEVGYVNDLRGSLLSFQNWHKQYQLPSDTEGMKSTFHGHLARCNAGVQEIYANMSSAVSRELPAVVEIGQWPRICPMFFLHQLSRHRWSKVTEDWRCCIIRYALGLTELQRAERLVNLVDSRVDLIKELRDPGHTNWDPMEHPECLLLEVESGILIRYLQKEIASQMKDVVENATMQLNMGEGKSSVIIPIVAAALADGTRLVRTITAKPQAKQMSQMLISKLGGLVDRRVYYMPFSRSLRLEHADAVMIGDMCRECMENGGVLLVQPEHLLSFKLMGLECFITDKDTIGRSLLHIQEFFVASSRDIVDESDDNFSDKLDLVYTMGEQRPIELSPQRWTCIQQVLELVKMFAPEVVRENPASMEMDAGPPGSFPRTRILDDDGQQRLFTRVARRLCEVGLEGFPIARQLMPIREAVFRYLTEPSLKRHEIDQVESQGLGGFWTEATKQTLLLLRGLLARGIMPFAFRQKRWRVQYGLDASRRPPTKLAVPYRAKDSPTLRSEFSHPDVVIVLTCLSHYYGGIDDDDLFLAFENLLKSDQGGIEYQEWVKDVPHLPPAFRQLTGINLKDRHLCVEQLFPPFRHAKKAIDYFLTHLVFPKEMREFPHKLSVSGWDIGQTKALPTSGFSGTSDSRMTLPLSVAHLDLPEQKHTNALVLEHLLRPENSVVLMPAPVETCNSTAESLLNLVAGMDPPAQVILDVGAQILELTNGEVAREWLKRTRDDQQAQAVVFFNEDDELSVIDRNGQIERLQTSPFADQLDVCLVFLDEAHTRGTDLKLPAYYKAAVTLGANLTKDRLVQACMRMRKLGQGQSVVFCVPKEIERQFLSQKKAPESTDIGVPDVLCWAITETWADTRRSIPLWALQGRRFEHQRQLWATAGTEEEVMSRRHAERFLEEEAQTLEDRYRPSIANDTPAFMQANHNINLRRIEDRCREFHTLEHSTATLREEQERELSPEIVQEREVQRPAPAEPALHRIHADVKAFVMNGAIKNRSNAFKPAFETLRQTSAASHLDLSQFPCGILTTVDFASTVQSLGQSSLLDSYQRPVQWILTSIGDGRDNNIKHVVIISPYEAQMLLTDIRSSTRVTLHLYAPRPNLGIRPIDGLDLYRVTAMLTPSTLSRQYVYQLNLFAGQLYLDSFQEYVEVCTLLGVASEAAKEGSTIAADGFIIRDCNGQVHSASTFRDSPVSCLRVLMTKIRKNCEEIGKTHMGAILGGRLLSPSDFGT